MESNITASQTALFSAAARAAHPLVDSKPYLVVDEEALALCKTVQPSPLDYQLAQPGAPVLAAARLSACTRSRFAESILADTTPEQILILGAGLDTTAFRLAESLQEKLWVLDLEGVLNWRSELFDTAGLTDSTHHIAADLSQGLNLEKLEAAGIDLERPITMIWLGVSMYLEPQDCHNFFNDLSELTSGSSLIFDYHVSPELRDQAGSDYAQAVSAMAGSSGEPWKLSTTPEEIEAWLNQANWQVKTDIDEVDTTPEGFFEHQKHLQAMKLVRFVHANLE